MKSEQLTALKVARTKAAGRYVDGKGLCLVVKPTGARSWVLRVQSNGNRRDIGLGAVDMGERIPGAATDAIESVPLARRKSLNLAEARLKAAEGRRLILAGLDPVVEWSREQIIVPTFEAAARDYHAKHEGDWRNPKHAAQWLSTLVTYAFDKIGAEKVDAIDARSISSVLAPIWLEKPETAQRVQQRICTVLAAAKHDKQRSAAVPTPKEIREGLSKRTDTNSKVRTNFAAMPYDDVPDLMARLRGSTQTIARRALLFTILTAARSGETRGMKWAEIDFDKAVWTIPADRMKRGRVHRVPLSAPALAILAELKGLFSPKPDALVFPGLKGPISDATMAKALRVAEGGESTVHGMRSAFRDWCAEKMPSVPGDVAEAALSHVVKNKTEAAYRRAEYLDQRRDLMAKWSDYLGQKSNVVQLAAARA